ALIMGSVELIGGAPMLRPRPIARVAVTTAVVAGTATRVSGRVQRRQERRGRESVPARGATVTLPLLAALCLPLGLVVGAVGAGWLSRRAFKRAPEVFPARL